MLQQKVKKKNLYSKHKLNLAQVAQLVGVLCCKLKGPRFDSESGHIWEATNPCFSLTLIFLSFPSKIKTHTLKKKKKKKKKDTRQDPPPETF